MPREQISVDIPDEWNENMKHGRCWCGKPNSEFEKGQKFYCSKDHARTYSKRIVYWSSFKDKVLEERENKCVKCVHDKTSFRLEQEKLELYALNQVIIKHQTAIDKARAVLIKHVQEEFEKIKDDSYVLSQMPKTIREEYGIPSRYDIFHNQYFHLDVDHIRAVCLGGEMWDKKNLQLLCTNCHKVKTKDDMKKLRIKHKQEKNQTLEHILQTKGEIHD